MRIAFDAKRIYQNRTGLGNYSRTLVSSLAKYFPEHEYLLFAPKKTDLYDHTPFDNITDHLPQSSLHKILKSAWRSKWVIADLQKNNVDIYHGLSHEIPFGIEKTNIKSVVTIHDLIFEKYPEQFSTIDVRIYRKKFINACKNANAIIAISEQTKQDIVSLYGIHPNKIHVCYQSCNEAFGVMLTEAQQKIIQNKYRLPDRFLLSVGSIIERKNLLNVCKAISLIPENERLPLIVIGDGDRYKQSVKKYIHENNLSEWIIFLSEDERAKQSPEFRNGKDLPGIFQLATAMLYPSIYEGFGIPVLEALMSQTPVITSNVSCLPEAGGDAAFYVDPFNPSSIATAINNIMNDNSLTKNMIAKGLEHAKNFTQEKCATAVMNVYKNL